MEFSLWIQEVNTDEEECFWYVTWSHPPSLCEGDQHQDPSDSGGWVHRDPEWHWHCLPALDRQTRDHAATGLQTPPTLICSQNRRTDLFVSMQWLHVILSLHLSGHGEHNVIISSRAQASGPLPGYCLVLFGIQVQKKKKCSFAFWMRFVYFSLSWKIYKTVEIYKFLEQLNMCIYTKTFLCSDIV